MVVPCFLIRHPKGDLVWDAGLPDTLHAQPGHQIKTALGTFSVPVTFASQLAAANIAPGEIEFFAPSHTHLDHIGNVQLLKAATIIINRKEHEFLFGELGYAETERAIFVDAFRDRETITYDNKYDVFGDGKIIIHSMPGHTPGHAVLQVTLNNHGPLLLTGDLFHLAESRQRRIVPSYNFDAMQTLASMTAFESLADELGADVVIQHAPEDFDRLPSPPQFLD